MSEQYKSRMEKRAKEKENKTGKNKKSGKPSSFKTIAKRIFLTLLVLGFIGLVSGVGVATYWISDAPKFDPAALKDPVPSTIYDMNNEPITELGIEKRDLVTFEEVPKLVQDSILATEDVRFFKHHGIDLIRLGGAVLSNITDGFGSQGASTLTQQVVKLSFLSDEKTLERKAQEAWLAIQLEQALTKEEIFELYVNKVAMGGNIYGIKQAAETYFGKDLDELTLPEAALIAGLPQRPNAYNPFVNPDLADKRKNTVLSLMHQHGFISEQEMREAQNTHISSLIVDPEEIDNNETPYQSFIDQIIDEVEQQGYNVYTDGLEIYTTLDRSAQERIYDILNSNEYINYPNEEIQAGVILLDTKTGEIRAIGGGRNQTVKRGINYAIDITRQPGSTIKPILDYGPAIEYLKWSTYHIFEDKPYTYSDGTPIHNYNRKHHGEVTMRTALQKSYNIPALQAFQAVGADRAREFAVKLGIPLEEQIPEAYSIGGFKHGIAPIHLAGALSAFGNGGYYNEPHAIRKIVTQEGQEIVLTPKPEKVMADYTAFMISDMLKTVVQSGTGTHARVPGVNIAGKTGTTNFPEKGKNGSPDAWFGGYSTNYSAAVWVGYPDHKKAVDNTRLPQLIFKQLMTYVHQGIETPDFEQPGSVVKLGIEKGSNPAKLASKYTPKDQVVYEYFIKGHEPKQVSKKFEKITGISNLSVEYNEEKQAATLKWNYGSDSAKFEVYVSINGSGESLVITTDKKGVEIENVAPGSHYRFIVYAVKDGQKSDPASVELDLSEQQTEEEQIDEENIIDEEENSDEGEDENENQQEDGNENQDEGNTNNNGNQNENGNRAPETNGNQNNNENNTNETEQNGATQPLNQPQPNQQNGGQPTNGPE